MASDFVQVTTVVEAAFSTSPLGYHGEANLVEVLRSSCNELVSLVAQCVCEFGGGDGTFQIAWLSSQPTVFEGAFLRYHPEFSRVGHP